MNENVLHNLMLLILYILLLLTLLYCYLYIHIVILLMLKTSFIINLCVDMIWKRGFNKKHWNLTKYCKQSIKL